MADKHAAQGTTVKPPSEKAGDGTPTVITGRVDGSKSIITASPANLASPASGLHNTSDPAPEAEAGVAGKDASFLRRLSYTPKRCRWNVDNPPQFNWPLCLLFAFAGMFTVANLYYAHPVMHILAEDFEINYETASRVATVMQAGYAGGLLFICPLADIVRRRPMVLLLIFVCSSFWLGLCFVTSWPAFLALSFLAAFTTVTPQVMLPLVASLAHPERRAMMISVVFAGLFGGILVARIFSGVITQYTSWRNVYFAAFGVQYLLLLLLYLFFPDYPADNQPTPLRRQQDAIVAAETGTSSQDKTQISFSSRVLAVVASYPGILTSIITIPTRQPVLVQTSLGSFLANASFVSFWTTLTFLLADPHGPYALPTLTIGLFALIGMPPFLINPFISQRLVTATTPLHAAIISLLIMLVGVLIGTFVGTFSLAGPIVMGFLVDLGMIMYQTSTRTLLVGVEPKASNRVNTVYMVTTFCGMLVGSTVGNSLYAAGGWHYSGYGDIGFILLAIGLMLARGPHEAGWFGWTGGWSWRKRGEVEEESDSSGAALGSKECPESS